MKEIFLKIVFIYTFTISYGCEWDYSNKCDKNEDCCSKYCYKEPVLKFGACLPRK